MSLQHVVLFSYREELSASQEADMFSQVRRFPETIGGIEELRLGPALSAERTRGYQYLMYMVLADEAALSRYQDHPAHLAFVSWIGEHGGSVLSFDYRIDEETVLHRAGS